MKYSSELEETNNIEMASEISNDNEDIISNHSNDSDISLLNDSGGPGAINDHEIDYSYVSINHDADSLQIKPKKSKKIICIIITLILLVLIYIIYSVVSYIITRFSHECIEPVITDEDYSIVRGKPYKDKFGIDLNQYMQKNMHSQKIPNNDTLENWDLYTPMCPHLEPVHYPEEILNPNCEELSLQFVNFNREDEIKIPYSLHLHNITNQIKKFNEWNKDSNKKIPNYRNEDVNSLFSDEYHPFDYGFYEEKETKFKTEEDIKAFYKKVVNSRMDEVPDPRHRRFFSFILFNSEFDFLDLFLATYYEIIDYFVIYESNVTFSGNPKPLLLTRMLTETNRYDKFKDKIITLPIPMSNICATRAFTKEGNARRRVVEMGLRAVNARHGDIFMHGDLDELPKPHIVTRLKKCGGWEHLQAGIGGGPKSTREKKVESYLDDRSLYEQFPKNKYDFPDLEYERVLSLCFNTWYYKYSFRFIEDIDVATRTTPNIAIFDAKRALGQYPEEYRNLSNENEKRSIKNKKRDDKINGNENTSHQQNQASEKRNYTDPLTKPYFDPYEGYSYRGFLGDAMRDITFQNVKKFNDKTDVVLWSAGWHMSSFLPTIDHFLNKILSYSHFDRFYFMSDEQLREYMIKHINEGRVYDDVDYYDFPIAYPKPPEKNYKYDFTYKTWLSFNDDHEKFKEVKFMLDHEIPDSVLQNPICYSYMIDRSFGLTKKLWWQVIPKDQWATVDFEKLDRETLEEITPSEIPDVLKPKALRNEN